ncbi:hypothetical protein AMK68_03170 [candidate division KD3-62 bacterium DG_56]|uniref:WG repeat-containing protein n=1 Tax=candidate division KD3-62 bacterium DG_56 TaxID=1704032 RepID=A0A0S7XMU1_9BACT|nr:MAG: hypothetical protein AMK68_03170 [candidate division KD3-62 bacterium DG_56]
MFTGAVRDATNARYLYVSGSSPSALPAGYEPLYPISRDHKFGFISRSGKVIIEPQFDNIGEMSEGLLPVGIGIVFDDEWEGIVRDGKCGYLAEDGDFPITPQFSQAGSFSEGLAAVRSEGATGATLWGYIDRTGGIVIQPQYGEAWDFAGGVAWVGKRLVYGAIDREGNEVLPFRYDVLETYNCWFNDGLCFVKEGQYDPMGRGPTPSYYFVDKEGKVAIRVAGVDNAAFFDQGVCFARGGGLWGLINRKGEWVVTPRYHSCYTYGQGMAEVAHYSDIVTTFHGKKWIKRCYAKCVYTFSEGLALVEEGGRFGYIDDRGREIIGPQYEKAAFFVEGLAKVRIDGKYGYIDKQNNIVIKPQYDDASDFQEGLAYVKVRGKYGFIDKSGKMVIPPRFREVSQFKYALAPIYEGRKWGYINRAGKVIWRPTI